MRGMWRITLWHPERDDGRCVYLVPHWQARTEVAARAAAAARHSDQVSVMTDPSHWHDMVVGEVAFRPAVPSRERAVAWVALVKNDAITERGWPLAAERGGRIRDESWRTRVAEMHAQYRERVIGFGNSLADIMTSLADTDAAWDLAPYRDRFGRIEWDQVRTDIHRSALSYTWHTPYGVVWINQG